MTGAQLDGRRGALVLGLRRAGVTNLELLRAIETTPREFFAPARLRDLADRDCPLPIACGQTMHAPGVVARMLAALDVTAQDRVLEIGTGSGYCAALLSKLAREVVTIERFSSLAVEARARLEGFSAANVIVRHADGLAAPETLGRFDRVIVHACVTDSVDRLLGALSPSGRIVCGQESREGEMLTILSPGVAQRLQPCRLGPALRGLSKAL